MQTFSYLLQFVSSFFMTLEQVPTKKDPPLLKDVQLFKLIKNKIKDVPQLQLLNICFVNNAKFVFLSHIINDCRNFFHFTCFIALLFNMDLRITSSDPPNADM